MRRVLAGVSAVVAIVALGASPAFAAKAPVKLDGTVNNHGTKNVSKKTAPAVKVELDDFYIAPTFLKVKPGEQVTFDVENEGNTRHTFTSDALGFDQALNPGKSATVTVTVPDDASVFRVFCSIHEGIGMQGALFTKAKAKAPPASAASTAASLNSGSGSYGY
jgi:plastocyanin